MGQTKHFDVVVMGGGSGLTAAYFADKDGKSVALVDKRPHALGGTCVNRGCIPTKGMIQAAEVMKTIREASKWGIHVPLDQVSIDFSKIMGSVHERRTGAAKGVKGWVDRAFTPFYGHAAFVDDKVIEVDGKRLTGDKIFIATGARPAVPPIPGLDKLDHWTNEETIDNTERPDSLVILGGGYIGVEFAHFFAEMGTKVTVIESQGCLLREDDDVRSLFTKEFAKKVRLMNNTRAVEAVAEGGRQGFVVEHKETGKRETVLADRVLVAVGRRPNTDELGLDRTGVKTNDKGWVVVDDRLCTTHPDIYAYGDVIGQEMFKHTSSYEGELAYRNSQGADLVVDYHANPHAIFSDPQIGAVGLTETQAREQGLDFAVTKVDYDSIAKGEIVGHPPGLAKLIVENGTDRILGFHMVGPHAADLVHEVVVAMNAGDGTADLIRRAIHIHPTMPELIRSVFDGAAP